MSDEYENDSQIDENENDENNENENIEQYDVVEIRDYQFEDLIYLGENNFIEVEADDDEQSTNWSVNRPANGQTNDQMDEYDIHQLIYDANRVKEAFDKIKADYEWISESCNNIMKNITKITNSNSDEYYKLINRANIMLDSFNYIFDKFDINIDTNTHDLEYILHDIIEFNKGNESELETIMIGINNFNEARCNYIQ